MPPPSSLNPTAALFIPAAPNPHPTLPSPGSSHNSNTRISSNPNAPTPRLKSKNQKQRERHEKHKARPTEGQTVHEFEEWKHRRRAVELEAILNGAKSTCGFDFG